MVKSRDAPEGTYYIGRTKQRDVCRFLSFLLDCVPLIWETGVSGRKEGTQLMLQNVYAGEQVEYLSHG